MYPIGRTIFVTSEIISSDQSKAEDEIFSLWKKSYRFSCLSGGLPKPMINEQLSLFPLTRGFSLKLFKSCRYSFIGGIHWKSRKRKQTLQNKALQNVALLNGRPQFHSPCLFAYLSTSRRYLRVLLFMVVNSAFLSTAFINRQPWQFQKLRRAFFKRDKKKRLIGLDSKLDWNARCELMFT